jgi:hypothetical protein
MSGRHKNLWLSSCGSVHNVTKYCKYQYKKALSHFDWRFPMILRFFSNKNEYVETKKAKKTGKMNMSRIEANEEYMLYLNLCKRSKKTSVKHRVVKTNHNAQTCANYQSENIIFNMSNHPQTWRIGELSAPSVCVYIYMYNTEGHKIQRPTQLSSSVGSSSMIRRRESHHQAMGLVRTRRISLPARMVLWLGIVVEVES